MRKKFVTQESNSVYIVTFDKKTQRFMFMLSNVNNRNFFLMMQKKFFLRKKIIDERSK